MVKTGIAIFGGAHLDRRGRISGETAPAASNPGKWMEEPGGGGFNAARNLARLGHAVTMVSPRGGDAHGERVAAAATEAGVIDRPATYLDRATPTYTAILDRHGDLVIAIADMALYDLFSPRRLRQKALRELVGASDLVLCDANLPAATLTALLAMAKDAGCRTAGIGVSPAKVVRFTDGLPSLDFLFLNAAEAAALAGAKAETPADWPALLAAKGLAGGVVTSGAGAAVAFDGGQAILRAPRPLGEIGDVTGAGDALASGFLAAHLAGESLEECLASGFAAAAITLRSPYAVNPDLSPFSLAAERKAAAGP
ncbi:Sugar or nucleoside kinase, ribokinase family [Rhizobium sp. RU20A]|uniref:carbohydrate kinase family protein n=1 Tax=Rhizobium sp. RU20A TaxID=1907412 RepID=UPI000953AA52|nr:carbohydrate kinase family protein [Rhizobium sp. RU20A]SIQ13051.1 Sugar or nucleoside kinase, ribokinase family [Rhizobium sp. RU20A]